MFSSNVCRVALLAYCIVALLSGAANPQGKASLVRLAELATLKGFDVSLGQACKTFGLAGRADDGQCRALQLAADLDEEDARELGYGTDWALSFNTFIERSTHLRWLVLVAHDAHKGHVFLVSADGVLRKAANIKGREGSWTFSEAPLSPSLKAAFAKLTALWMKNGVGAFEGEPDRCTAAFKSKYPDEKC
jgi:hypothetical protein